MKLDFEEVIRDASAGNAKIPTGEYQPDGRYPIIDQGQDYIGGYTDEEANLVKGSGPWIVFGDHTRALKFVDKPFCMGADGVKVLALRNERATDLKYVFHFLKAANIPSVGYSRHYKYLKRLQIPLPPLDEQKRIAAILDKADQLCQKRRQAIALLDSLTQSIFLEMFGDPVSNPLAWPKIKFGQVSSSRLGKMLDQKKMEGLPTYPYLANFNVQWHRINLLQMREMGFSKEEIVEFALHPGDILMCEGGEIGRCAIWQGQLQNCYYQKALHRIRCHVEKLTPEYVVWMFWFLVKNGGLSAHTSTATIAHLTGEKLKTLLIPVPPIDLQRNFSKKIEQLNSMVNRVSVSNISMENLFSSLQHRAFSGQL